MVGDHDVRFLDQTMRRGASIAFSQIKLNRTFASIDGYEGTGLVLRKRAAAISPWVTPGRFDLDHVRAQV